MNIINTYIVRLGSPNRVRHEFVKMYELENGKFFYEVGHELIEINPTTAKQMI